MTGDEDELSRPFLGTTPLPGHSPDPAEVSDQVRPYLITTGRTSTPDVAVEMQTVVVAAVSGMASDADPASDSSPASDSAEVCPNGTAEHARIVELCRKPHSVAELAAGLRVPLGVARVLVADLLSTGLLDTGPPSPQQATDVPFLERLIAGVAAL